MRHGSAPATISSRRWPDEGKPGLAPQRAAGRRPQRAETTGPHPGRRQRSQRPATFAAMACIVKAWERYTQGDTGAARAALEHLQTAPELQPVFRYNPRVRFECLNLLALLHKRRYRQSRTGLPSGRGRRRAAGVERRAGSGLRGGLHRRRPTRRRQYRLVHVAVLATAADRPEREQAINAVQLQAMRWLGLSGGFATASAMAAARPGI